jgi:hypothetical protein
LADGGSAWKTAFAKAKAVVAKMTLEEKGELFPKQVFYLKLKFVLSKPISLLGWVPQPFAQETREPFHV